MFSNTCFQNVFLQVINERLILDSNSCQCSLVAIIKLHFKKILNFVCQRDDILKNLVVHSSSRHMPSELQEMAAMLYAWFKM